MMPPIPAVVMLPTTTAHGYWPATVVAAIPLGHGNVYAMTAIDPKSSPGFPAFFAATAGQSIHGFWVTERDETFPAQTLADALASMCGLAGLNHPDPHEYAPASFPVTRRQRTEPENREPVYAGTGEPEGTCNCDEPSGDKPGDDCRNCGYTLTMAQWDYLPR